MWRRIQIAIRGKKVAHQPPRQTRKRKKRRSETKTRRKPANPLLSSQLRLQAPRGLQTTSLVRATVAHGPAATLRMKKTTRLARKISLP
jgi:hypothetical protein